MRLILVFEDNRDSVTTKLIRTSYNDSEIIMAGGNYNLLKYFETGTPDCVWNPNDVFAILLDVVPDNGETIDGLDRLEKLIHTKSIRVR